MKQRPDSADAFTDPKRDLKAAGKIISDEPDYTQVVAPPRGAPKYPEATKTATVRIPMSLHKKWEEHPKSDMDAKTFQDFFIQKLAEFLDENN